MRQGNHRGCPYKSDSFLRSFRPLRLLFRIQTITA